MSHPFNLCPPILRSLCSFPRDFKTYSSEWGQIMPVDQDHACFFLIVAHPCLNKIDLTLCINPTSAPPLKLKLWPLNHMILSWKNWLVGIIRLFLPSTKAVLSSPIILDENPWVKTLKGRLLLKPSVGAVTDTVFSSYIFCIDLMISSILTF